MKSVGILSVQSMPSQCVIQKPLQTSRLNWSFPPSPAGFIYNIVKLNKTTKKTCYCCGHFIPNISYQVELLTSVILWGHGLSNDSSEGVQPLPLILLLLTLEHKLPTRRLQPDATAPSPSFRALAAHLRNRVLVVLRADEDSTQFHSILSKRNNIYN